MPNSTPTPDGDRARWAWRRLAAAYVGVLVCIWSEPARPLGGVLIALAAVASLLPWRGGRLLDYPSGFGWRGSGAAFLEAIPLVLGSLGILVYGWAARTDIPLGVLGSRFGVYLGWAILQQAFLQTFTQNTLRAIDDRPRFTVVLTGLLFCLIHLPNLPLAWISLPVILILNALFRRSPSLWPLVVIHAALAVFLDDVLDISMAVGPGFLGG